MPAEAWKLKRAFLYAAQGGFVTGRQIAVLLGSYIPHALFVRGGLSVPSELYAFVRAHYYEPVRLWASAAFECYVIAGILPVLVADYKRPWSTEIIATDASETVMGAAGKSFAPEEVAELGRWSEKWRFKRLPPEEWQPRNRGLASRLPCRNFEGC